MVSKYVRALALRVVYHIQQKLPNLHGQPTRTLVMMTTAFIAAGGPWLSQMGRQLADLPGRLQEKVKRMSRFLCQSRFEVREAFIDALPESLRRRIVILADRGFAKSDLMRDLSERKIPWVIRQPRNHKVCLEGSWKALSEIPLSPGEDLFLHDVRCVQDSPVQVQLACRRLPTGKANDPDDDTWYLATNVDDLKQALSWYTLRFQIEEMFRDLKSRLHMDKHLLGTEESVAKMMLIVALAYLVVLEDGTQWRGRIALDRIQKTTAWGTLSVYSIARACFDAVLPEAPAEVGDLIVARWTNLRAA